MKERPVSSKKEASDEVYSLEPRFDSDGVQVASGLDHQGREHPDPVPMAPPVGYKPPSDILQLIESVIRRRDFERTLQSEGYETAEEADDFDVGDDDYDPRFEETIYEKYFEAKSARASSDAPQKATSRTDGAGATSGGAAPPPPSSATSGAPKPAEAPSKSETE